MDFKVQWNDPTLTKVGQTFMWVRKWLIPLDMRSAFFSWWKKNSFSMKKDGFSVFKENSDWYLTESKFDKRKFSGQPSSKPEDKSYDHIWTCDYSLKDSSILRPWQIPAATKLCGCINKFSAAVDGSDLGTGKTFTSISVARDLKMNLAVVCPKAVVGSWSRVANDYFQLGDNFIGAINYELLIRGKSDSKFASIVHDKKSRRDILKWKLPKNTLIVWDECQRLKNWKTKSSKSCILAYKQGYKQLFASATVATNPLEMRTIGTCLGLFKGSKGYQEWLTDHGVEMGRFGLEFNNDVDVLKKINKYLFEQHGYRVRRDTIPGFPETEIMAECYDMDEQDKKQINTIYSEMSKELSRLSKTMKSDGDSILTVKLRARQKIELIKVPLFIEMIEEGLENNMSVVVFLNFTETLQAIKTRLSVDCVYDGKTNDKDKELAVEKFKNNESKVFLVNIQSGGAGLDGLQDFSGVHPRLAIISPTWSPFMMRQATGRVCREGSKSKSIQKIIFVSGTVEEEVAERVQGKLNNLDVLNDGDLEYEKNNKE